MSEVNVSIWTALRPLLSILPLHAHLLMLPACQTIPFVYEIVYWRLANQGKNGKKKLWGWGVIIKLLVTSSGATFCWKLFCALWLPFNRLNKQDMYKSEHVCTIFDFYSTINIYHIMENWFRTKVRQLLCNARLLIHIAPVTHIVFWLYVVKATYKSTKTW